MARCVAVSLWVNGGGTGFGFALVGGGVGFCVNTNGPGSVGQVKVAAPGIMAYAVAVNTRAR